MKLMKWLLKISLTAVLISTLTILTTGIVVNSYLQSVLASFNIQLEAQPMGVGGIMKNLLGFNGSSGQDKVDTGTKGTVENNSAGGQNNDAASGSSSTQEEDLSSSEGSSKQDNDTEGTNSGATGGASDDSNENGDDRAVEGEAPPEDSLPVMGRIAGESAAGQGDQQIVMTPDEMVDKKSSLTTKEKEEIFTLLMSKLPQAEMQKISEAMEDGLTASELDEIENGISKYLSKDEFEKLMTMLQK
ncbi:MAG: hypothetical protein ACQEXX_06515 [Bacillota bacterium]